MEYTPVQKKSLALKRCYEFLLGTREGKAVLRDLAMEAYLVQTTMVAGDPGLTAFNEGRRSLFLHIINRLEMRPVDVHKFYKEINEDD